MKTRIAIFLIFITIGFFFNPTDTYAYCAQQAPRVGCGALQACPGTNRCCTDLGECLLTISCTPNQRFCDGGRLKTCNDTGNGIVGSTVDCTINGGTCVASGGSANCVALTSSECYQDCLSRGNAPGECRAACNYSTSSGGSPGEDMIDLNALIGSIGGRIPQLTTLGAILTALLPILYGLAGVGLLIFLIVSGFSFLTSSGDPKKMEAAKGQITAAVLGFILIIAAFWITQIVNYIFGLGSGF